MSRHVPQVDHPTLHQVLHELTRMTAQFGTLLTNLATLLEGTSPPSPPFGQGPAIAEVVKAPAAPDPCKPRKKESGVVGVSAKRNQQLEDMAASLRRQHPSARGCHVIDRLVAHAYEQFEQGHVVLALRELQDEGLPPIAWERTQKYSKKGN